MRDYYRVYVTECMYGGIDGPVDVQKEEKGLQFASWVRLCWLGPHLGDGFQVSSSQRRTMDGNERIIQTRWWRRLGHSLAVRRASAREEISPPPIRPPPSRS